MIGIALVSHGRIAAELLHVTEEILGQAPQVGVVEISRQDRVSQITERISNLVRELDDGSGVLILTDALGGTACNQALELVDRLPIEVLTGMNLPLTLKAVTERHKLELPALARQLVEQGRSSIAWASSLLREVESPS